MPFIRPSSDLRNKYNEISEFCKRYNEPVFITKNGANDVVVISNAEYDRLRSMDEFRKLLDAGLRSSDKGNGKAAEDVFAEIERTFGFGEV